MDLAAILRVASLSHGAGSSNATESASMAGSSSAAGPSNLAGSSSMAASSKRAGSCKCKKAASSNNLPKSKRKANHEQEKDGATRPDRSKRARTEPEESEESTPPSSPESIRLPPFAESGAARARVLNIAELLEQILVHLPMQQLFKARGVCQTFRSCIDHSPIVRQAMWLSQGPPSKTGEAPVGFGAALMDFADNYDPSFGNLNPLLLDHFRLWPFVEKARTTRMGPVLQYGIDFVCRKAEAGKGIPPKRPKRPWTLEAHAAFKRLFLVNVPVNSVQISIVLDFPQSRDLRTLDPTRRWNIQGVCLKIPADAKVWDLFMIMVNWYQWAREQPDYI